MKSIYVPMNGETGSVMGPNGKKQTRLIQNAIKKSFPNAKIIFHPNHYECSCFIKINDNNIIYMSTFDYRFFNQKFFIRKAKNENDFIGGVNHNYCGFDNIVSAIYKLSKENEHNNC